VGMDQSNFSTILTDNQAYIIAGLFLFFLLVQLVFYLAIYSRVAFLKKKDLPDITEPVSVIICARNESDNLEKYLPVVLTQKYPAYEVIVVDDASSDDTDMLLMRFMLKYKNLRTTAIQADKKFSHGKKLAVTIGIKAAKNDIMAFIDADCVPAGDQWLQAMVSGLQEKKQLVLGYGGYMSRKGLLNKYVRYDTLIIAMQYLSHALSGFPYMGVGRNMVYRKSFFYTTAGFSRHLHLLSGDDDLFVNENANGQNTAVEFSHESHTRSAPVHSFEKWISQKKRHLTTSPLYKAKDKFLLGLEPFSRLGFYVLLIVLLFIPGMQWLALGAFLLRLIVQVIIIKNTMIRLKENTILLYSLLFDLISLFINFVIFVSNRLSARKRPWK
jgi:cellulose synthase/poly-beta-1,6-N-acetylglucosamine synthase-like glycosyltransferase